MIPNQLCKNLSVTINFVSVRSRTLHDGVREEHILATDKLLEKIDGNEPHLLRRGGGNSRWDRKKTRPFV